MGNSFQEASNSNTTCNITRQSIVKGEPQILAEQYACFEKFLCGWHGWQEEIDEDVVPKYEIFQITPYDGAQSRESNIVCHKSSKLNENYHHQPQSSLFTYDVHVRGQKFQFVIFQAINQACCSSTIPELMWFSASLLCVNLRYPVSEIVNWHLSLLFQISEICIQIIPYGTRRERTEKDWRSITDDWKRNYV